MNKVFKNIFVVLFLLITLISCESNEEVKKETSREDLSKVKVVIDSNAINIVKKDFSELAKSKNQEPATTQEINTMVSNKNESKLNEYQEFVQGFFNESAKQNYLEASKYLAYNGNDLNRKNKDFYNAANSNELSIVKSTVDVIFGFLKESKDYEFISFEEKSEEVGTVYIVELTFFKKGIGFNRRFFELIDSPKGKLIYNMK